MKIIFISAFSGCINRGIETWVNEVATRLSKNHEVTVFQLGKKSGNENYNIEQINIEEIDWKRKSNIFTENLKIDYWSKLNAKFTYKAIPKIKEIQPDIIIPLQGGWQTIICKIFCISLKYKLIWFGHIYEPFTFLLRPDLYITISPLQGKISRNILKIKTKFIPNGINTERFKPFGEIYIHNLKPPVVLFVGALIDWKKPDLTIHAVSNTKNMSLLMVGEGEDKYIEMGKKLLGDRFKHINANFEDMPKIYRSADIFTLPSDKHRETFGLVYLEAMACGLPIVATDDKTRRFVIGEAGIYLSKPSDIDVYSNKLQEALIRNESKNFLSQIRKFDLNKVVEEYEKAFEDAVI